MCAKEVTRIDAVMRYSSPPAWKIVMLAAVATGAIAQMEMAFGKVVHSAAWVNHSDGAIEAVQEDENGNPSFWRYRIPAKYQAQTAMYLPLSGDEFGVIVTLGDKTVVHVPKSAMEPFVPSGIHVPEKAAPVSIPISNDADTLDVACGGRTAVVVGANSPTPVSLVDLVDQREVATVAYADKLARSVAVDDDGRQALVVVDAATISTGGAIRRVAIANGAISDAGEDLAFGGEYVSRVAFAPGAKTGVAIVGGGTTRLVAFTVPGLVAKGSVALGGGIGNAVAFSPAGDRVFVRSGRRLATDVIEAFNFDAGTGAIGQTPMLRITDVSGFTGTVYQSSMAITPDGASLVVADENTGGRLPAPRIATFNVATGALVKAQSLDQDAQPRIVATPRACKSLVATQPLVEYHHAAFDHYFVTGIANEIALLDNGALAGWARTGEGFNVYPTGTPGSAATCRFFTDKFPPTSSHFYTPFAAECATVKANARWTFEGEVFDVALPAADGSCPAPTMPLYRVYNEGQGGAPNHRYTTRLDTRSAMVAAGWTPEGNGIGVIACVPP